MSGVYEQHLDVHCIAGIAASVSSSTKSPIIENQHIDIHNLLF